MGVVGGSRRGAVLCCLEGVSRGEQGLKTGIEDRVTGDRVMPTEPQEVPGPSPSFSPAGSCC